MSVRTKGVDRSGDNSSFEQALDAFLSVALTPELRAAGRNTTGVYSDITACRVWHRRLFEQGWIAPAWPPAFGGTNWTPAQRLRFDRECAANDAPVLFAGGIRSLGPLLIAVGTHEQKRRYLPAILDGSDLWCQGFSEPGAGSDLAAIQTRADVGNGHYVLNGSKIWTTGAHVSNRMFCLARTARLAKPQQGITFLLVDMASRGITVRPIRTLSGDCEFNEVLLENVLVPFSDRVGEEGDGWAVAKRLMQYARANNTTTGLLRRAYRRAAHFITSFGMNERSLLRAELLAIDCDMLALEALELRILGECEHDGVSAVQASTIKTLATELHQRIASLIIDAAGPAANSCELDQSQWCSDGAFASAKYFSTRAASIYSGTNETHRNLIAQHLLRFD
jgi:acyl-CoA dehydrogenase